MRALDDPDLEPLWKEVAEIQEMMERLVRLLGPFPEPNAAEPVNALPREFL